MVEGGHPSDSELTDRLLSQAISIHRVGSQYLVGFCSQCLGVNVAYQLPSPCIMYQCILQVVLHFVYLGAMDYKKAKSRL